MTRTGVAAALLWLTACDAAPTPPGRNAALAFGAPQRIEVPAHPNTLSVADLDGDGDLDIAVPGLVDAAVRIVRNDGGTLVALPQQPLPAGVLDAVILPRGPGEVAIVYSFPSLDRVGLFAAVDDGGSLALAEVAHFPVRAPGPMVAADLDGDGVDDLVVSSWTEEALIPFHRTAGQPAAFQFSRGMPASFAKGQALAAVDLDRDGASEIAAISGLDSQLAILVAEPTGWRAVARAQTQAWPTSLITADLEGDGDIALIGTANLGDRVFIADPAGLGALQMRSLPAGAGAFDVAAADLDGDGLLDLAVTNKFEDTLTLYRNTGGGQLLASLTLPTGSGPSPLAVADLDDDGGPDLILADGFANDLLVYFSEAGPR